MFVRWEEQEVDHEEGRRLPGLARPEKVRTFDAPEAMGVRFHEVEARSAINSVGGNTLPFNHTINPYRGCSHACTYCLTGDTELLMSDGRARRLDQVVVGDLIYGTVRRGQYRRYVTTRVLAHWGTLKAAYRVTLADGTTLTASADHRFLTERGWKHVAPDPSGGQRPYLTTNNKLIGVGNGGTSSAAAKHTPQYRRGYVCGLVRGDGTLGRYVYEGPGRGASAVYRFRLALADHHALYRAQRYLADFGVPTRRFRFADKGPATRGISAIRCNSRAGVEAIRDLIEWPGDPDPDQEWTRGYLAGIFDAEGSYCRGILRIANTDDEIIERRSLALDSQDLEHVVEDRGLPSNLRSVRIRGGLRCHLKFFLATDPAITRKRVFAGQAVKSQADLRVVSVEPLRAVIPMYDITTGTGDFIANGVVSHNCFARPTHRYLDLNAREDFEREIVVKVNLPERLRVELKRPSWKGDVIALGTNTDPYQWVEGRYRLTREIWEVLLEARNPCSVLTKSPLLLRDIDLFKRLVEVTDFTASLSIPTLDESAWRASEPRTPHPRKRIEAVAELNRAGIPAGVLVAPLMPGINDSPAQVEEILRLCADAGARSVSGLGLHLKGEVREIFLDWLRSYRPDLLPRYEQLYAKGAFLPREERDRIGALLGSARRKAGVRNGWTRSRARAKERPAGGGEQPPQGSQRSLF